MVRWWEGNWSNCLYITELSIGFICLLCDILILSWGLRFFSLVVLLLRNYNSNLERLRNSSHFRSLDTFCEAVLL